VSGRLDAPAEFGCGHVLADAYLGGRQPPLGRSPQPQLPGQDLARQLASDTGRVSRMRGNASVMSASGHDDQADAHELLR